jgi:serine protease inhibitor
MTHLAITILLALIVLFVATSSIAETPASASRSTADSSNAFALDLYARLKTTPGNVFLSPYSIATTLAMVREGAEGKTAKQMTAVLHLGKGTAGAAHGALAKALKPGLAWHGDEQKPAYELSIANAVWAQKGVNFLDRYTTTLKDAYGAPLEVIDFANPKSARARINKWVEERTRGKIENIVPAGKPAPDTRLVLANAIYFKAPWNEEFEKEDTKRATFTTTSGRTVRPKMMSQTEHFRYAEVDDAQILEMHYKGGEASMVFLLPKAKDGLPALEKKLTAATLKTWLAGVEGKDVAVTIPKFSFTSNHDLTETLPAMGMANAFSADKADFKGMTTEIPLFIGAVLHKAFIAIDEEGTEAAAATVAMATLGAAPSSGRPVVFKADHPFLILIRHGRTGCILFMGRVEDPTKN